MFRAPLCPSSGVQGCTLLHTDFSTVKDKSNNFTSQGYLFILYFVRGRDQETEQRSTYEYMEKLF
jgi:hypothetical protein